MSLLAIGLWLFVPCASGQTYVELDGDGILGNGPDIVGGAVGDTVLIDVYLHHNVTQGRLCYAWVPLCANQAVSLSTEFWTGPWVNYAVPMDTCLGLYGSDVPNFCDNQIDSPVRFASVKYVIEGCPGSVHVEDSDSEWIDSVFDAGVFSGSIPVWLCAETPTETSESSWGSIKELFR
jgi:hypothetical protein